MQNSHLVIWIDLIIIVHWLKKTFSCKNKQLSSIYNSSIFLLNVKYELLVSIIHTYFSIVFVSEILVESNFIRQYSSFACIKLNMNNCFMIYYSWEFHTCSCRNLIICNITFDSAIVATAWCWMKHELTHQRGSKWTRCSFSFATMNINNSLKFYKSIQFSSDLLQFVEFNELH